VSAAGPADPVVRPRTAADLPACVSALAAVHACDGYPTRWPADPAGWLAPPGTAAAWVAQAPGREGAVAGHVALVRTPDGALAALAGAAPDALVTVSRLFVAPGARGRGLATSLLAVAVARAAGGGLSAVLDVVEGTPAAALYERLGWRLLERRTAGWTLLDGRRPQELVYAAPPAP